MSFELGFRGNISQRWSYDVAAFYNDYDKLSTGNLVGQSLIFQAPYPVPLGVQLDYAVGNNGKGTSKGLEAELSGVLTDWWKTKLSYSYIDLSVESDPGTYVLSGDGATPHHQLRLELKMNLSDNFSFDSFVHYVGEAQNGLRKAYTDLDLRATYRFAPGIELSAVGSNLLDKRRLEYYQDSLPLELVYVPRSAYLEARIRF